MRLFFLIGISLMCFFSTGQDTAYQSILIDKSLADNANTVVRLNEMTVDLVSKKEMVIKLNRVVTVLNKLGSKHAQTSVGYNKSVKVKNIEAIIYNTLGEELDKIRKKDFKDVSAVDDGTLYSDSRILYMEYTPIQYPYTVNFSYEITTSNTSNIPNWYFLDGFLVSTEKSKYSITYKSESQKPVIKEKNIASVDFTKTTTSNSITYEASNINAIRNESHSPSFSKIAPGLMVRAVDFHYEGYDGLVSDWNDLGTWMYSNLLKEKSTLSEVTKSKARSIVNGVTDDLEKAKLIYEYVQENTRYISVQVGIGGIQPISAMEVDRVKYGDCKGLSNYTKALLEAVGVTSYYTHVEAGRNKIDFEDDFADLAQGNHVILAIPYSGTYYWIDCTSQVHPFGFIGDFTDGRKVLVIKPDGGELSTTTSYINEENYQKTIATYAIDKTGSVSANVIMTTEGIQYDNRFHLENETKEGVTKYYKNHWDNINNLVINENEFKNDKENIIFTETVSIAATNYATISGDRILFAINAFNKNSYVPDRYRNRKLPLEIQRGYLYEDEYEINLPLDYALESLPIEKIIDNEFGSYEVKYEYNETEKIIKYNRRLLLKEGNYPKEKYNAYRNFRKEISSTDNAKVVLIKNAK